MNITRPAPRTFRPQQPVNQGQPAPTVLARTEKDAAAELFDPKHIALMEADLSTGRPTTRTLCDAAVILNGRGEHDRAIALIEWGVLQMNEEQPADGDLIFQHWAKSLLYGQRWDKATGETNPRFHARRLNQAASLAMLMPEGPDKVWLLSQIECDRRTVGGAHDFIEWIRRQLQDTPPGDPCESPLRAAMAIALYFSDEDAAAPAVVEGIPWDKFRIESEMVLKRSDDVFDNLPRDLWPLAMTVSGMCGEQAPPGLQWPDLQIPDSILQALPCPETSEQCVNLFLAQRALRSDKPSVASLRTAVDCLMITKRYGKARSLLTWAVQAWADPASGRDARVALAEFQLQMSRPAEALRVLADLPHEGSVLVCRLHAELALAENPGDLLRLDNEVTRFLSWGEEDADALRVIQCVVQDRLGHRDQSDEALDLILDNYAACIIASALRGELDVAHHLWGMIDGANFPALWRSPALLLLQRDAERWEGLSSRSQPLRDNPLHVPVRFLALSEGPRDAMPGSSHIPQAGAEEGGSSALRARFSSHRPALEMKV